MSNNMQVGQNQILCIKKDSFIKKVIKSKQFLLMLLPGVVWLLVFCYLPMPGALIAFKDLTFFKSNIFANFLNSKWIGLDNFKFFFVTPDALTITRNTVLYNLVFIGLGLVASVTVAIALHEIHSRRMMKFYQTTILLPTFLSWIVVSYLVYSILNPDIGVANTILVKDFHLKAISWYTTPKYWPFFLVFLNMWKGLGMSSVIYFAAITGIDTELYEAASIDGAKRWHQIWHITIPGITPQMYILTIMSLGGIFNADFGLFWQATMRLGGGNSTEQVILPYSQLAIQLID